MARGIVVPVSGDTRKLEKDIAKIAGKPVQLQRLDAKKFTQPLGKIRGELGEFEKSLEASNARVIAFGASAGAIYAVGDALRQTVRSMVEVEKSLAEVNVILGTSQKSLANFGNELFKIAGNTAQSFQTVATAATELARQGLGVEETLKRTNNALILTRLSGLGVVDSVNAIPAAINGFSKAALNSTQIVNRLIAVDQAFAVSGADLAESLKRVGNTAEGAGVSFNQLLAVVTAAQQTTARGGAVIGNSFKTIFTRIQRPRTIEALEALGVATKDASGAALSAIGVLNNLAKGYDKLAASQQAQIAELVGGVFQINILKATLADLGKEFSIYGNALKSANSAVNEAEIRNAQLNKTLSATINATLVNAQRAATALGQITLEPALKRSLGAANKILGGFDPNQSKSVGEKIGKGILEGVGTFLSGPGLLLAGVGLYKLFEKLRTFAADAFRTVTGLTTQSQKRAGIEKRVTQLLEQEPALLEQIRNKEISIGQAHQVILTLVKAETKALQEQKRIVEGLSSAMMKTGRVSFSDRGLELDNKGRIPNFASSAAQKEAKQATASYGMTVRPKDTFPTMLDMGGGRKQPAQVNKKETIIRKKDSKKVFGKQADGDTVIAGGGKAKERNISLLKQRLFRSSGMVPNFYIPNFVSEEDLKLIASGKGPAKPGSPRAAAMARFDADPNVIGMRREGQLGEKAYAVSTYRQMLPRYLKRQAGQQGEQPRLDVLGAVYEPEGVNLSKPNVRQYGFRDAAALGRFNTSFPTRYENMIDGMATDVLAPLPTGKNMLQAFKAKPLDAAAFGQVKGRVWESFVSGMTDMVQAQRKGDEPIDLKGVTIGKDFMDLFTPGMSQTGQELRLGGAAGITSKKAREKMGLAKGYVPNFTPQDVETILSLSRADKGIDIVAKLNPFDIPGVADFAEGIGIDLGNDKIKEKFVQSPIETILRKPEFSKRLSSLKRFSGLVDAEAEDRMLYKNYRSFDPADTRYLNVTPTGFLQYGNFGRPEDHLMDPKLGRESPVGDVWSEVGYWAIPKPNQNPPDPQKNRRKIAALLKKHYAKFGQGSLKFSNDGLIPNFFGGKPKGGDYSERVNAALKAARRGEADSFKRFAEISGEEGGPKRSTLQKWVFSPGWRNMKGSGSVHSGKSLSEWGLSSPQNTQKLDEIVDWGIEYKSRGEDKELRNKKIALGRAFEKEFAQYLNAKLGKTTYDPIDFTSLPAAPDKRKAIKMETGYTVGDTIWGTNGHGDISMADKIIRYMGGLSSSAKRQINNPKVKNVNLGDFSNIVEILGSVKNEKQPGLVDASLEATGKQLSGAFRISKSDRNTPGGGELYKAGLENPDKRFTLDYSQDYVTVGNKLDKKIRDRAFPKAKKSLGHIPNFVSARGRETPLYDLDGTIITDKKFFKWDDPDAIKGLTSADLTPLGNRLKQSKELIDIATARSSSHSRLVKSALGKVGLNVGKVMPLGSMFTSQTEMGKRGKPIKMRGPSKKRLIADKLGRDLVDNDMANIDALGEKGIYYQGKSKGFVPSFAALEDAMKRENSATGKKDSIALYSNMLKSPVVVNQGQVAKYGSNADRIIREDHIKQGQVNTKSNLMKTGSGQERYAYKGAVPNFAPSSDIGVIEKLRRTAFGPQREMKALVKELNDVERAISELDREIEVATATEKASLNARRDQLTDRAADIETRQVTLGTQNDRGERIRERAFQASFAFPMAAQTVKQFVTTSKKAEEGMETFIEGVTLGTTALQLIPGPAGLVAAGATAAASAFLGVGKALTAYGEEVGKTIEAQKKSNQEANDALGQYAQTLSKYNEALKSGRTTNETLADLQNKLASLMAKLPSTVRNQLRTAADQTQAQEALAKAQTALQKQISGNTVAEGMLNFINDNRGFMNQLTLGAFGDRQKDLGTVQTTAFGQSILSGLDDKFLEDFRKGVVQVSGSSKDFVRVLENQYGLQTNLATALAGFDASNFSSILDALDEAATLQVKYKNQIDDTSKIVAPFNRQLEQLGRDVKTLNSAFKSTLDTVNLLADAEIRASFARGERGRGLATERFSGAAGLRKTFQGAEAQADMNKQLKIFNIQNASLAKNEKLIATARKKSLEDVRAEVMKKVSQRGGGKLEGGVESVENKEFQVELAQLINRGITARPEVFNQQLEALLSNAQARGVIQGDKLEDISRKLSQNNQELRIGLRENADEQRQQIRKIEIQTAFTKLIARQTRDIQSFGGADALVDPKKLDESANNFLSGLDAFSAGAIKGNSFRQGQGAFMLAQGMMDFGGMNPENLVSTSLGRMAVQARAAQISNSARDRAGALENRASALRQAGRGSQARVLELQAGMYRAQAGRSGQIAEQQIADALKNEKIGDYTLRTAVATEGLAAQLQSLINRPAAQQANTLRNLDSTLGNLNDTTTALDTTLQDLKQVIADQEQVEKDREAAVNQQAKKREAEAITPIEQKRIRGQIQAAVGENFATNPVAQFGTNISTLLGGTGNALPGFVAGKTERVIGAVGNLSGVASGKSQEIVAQEGIENILKRFVVAAEKTGQAVESMSDINELINNDRDTLREILSSNEFGAQGLTDRGLSGSTLSGADRIERVEQLMSTFFADAPDALVRTIGNSVDSQLGGGKMDDFIKALRENTQATQANTSSSNSSGGSGGNANPFALPAAPSFEGGGFTGNRARSGGLDGRGGFPAILHPKETVVDHAKMSRGFVPNFALMPDAVEAAMNRLARQDRLDDMRKLAKSTLTPRAQTTFITPRPGAGTSPIATAGSGVRPRGTAGSNLVDPRTQSAAEIEANRRRPIRRTTPSRPTSVSAAGPRGGLGFLYDTETAPIRQSGAAVASRITPDDMLDTPQKLREPLRRLRQLNQLPDTTLPAYDGGGRTLRSRTAMIFPNRTGGAFGLGGVRIENLQDWVSKNATKLDKFLPSGGVPGATNVDEWIKAANNVPDSELASYLKRTELAMESSERLLKSNTQFDGKVIDRWGNFWRSNLSETRMRFSSPDERSILKGIESRINTDGRMAMFKDNPAAKKILKGMSPKETVRLFAKIRGATSDIGNLGKIEKFLTKAGNMPGVKFSSNEIITAIDDFAKTGAASSLDDALKFGQADLGFLSGKAKGSQLATIQRTLNISDAIDKLDNPRGDVDKSKAPKALQDDLKKVLKNSGIKIPKEGINSSNIKTILSEAADEDLLRVLNTANNWTADFKGTPGYKDATGIFKRLKANLGFGNLQQNIGMFDRFGRQNIGQRGLGGKIGGFAGRAGRGIGQFIKGGINLGLAGATRMPIIGTQPIGLGSQISFNQLNNATGRLFGTTTSSGAARVMLQPTIAQQTGRVLTTQVGKGALGGYKGAGINIAGALATGFGVSYIGSKVGLSPEDENAFSTEVDEFGNMRPTGKPKDVGVLEGVFGSLFAEGKNQYDRVTKGDQRDHSFFDSLADHITNKTSARGLALDALSLTGVGAVTAYPLRYMSRQYASTVNEMLAGAQQSQAMDNENIQRSNASISRNKELEDYYLTDSEKKSRENLSDLQRQLSLINASIDLYNRTETYEPDGKSRAGIKSGKGSGKFEDLTARQADMTAKSAGLFGLFGVAYGKDKPRRAMHERSVKDKNKFKSLIAERTKLQQRIGKARKDDTIQRRIKKYKDFYALNDRLFKNLQLGKKTKETEAHNAYGDKIKASANEILSNIVQASEFPPSGDDKFFQQKFGGITPRLAGMLGEMDLKAIAAVQGIDTMRMDESGKLSPAMIEKLKEYKGKGMLNRPTMISEVAQQYAAAYDNPSNWVDVDGDGKGDRSFGRFTKEGRLKIDRLKTAFDKEIEQYVQIMSQASRGTINPALDKTSPALRGDKRRFERSQKIRKDLADTQSKVFTTLSDVFESAKSSGKITDFHKFNRSFARIMGPYSVATDAQWMSAVTTKGMAAAANWRNLNHPDQNAAGLRAYQGTLKRLGITQKDVLSMMRQYPEASRRAVGTGTWKSLNLLELLYPSQEANIYNRKELENYSSIIDIDFKDTQKKASRYFAGRLSTIRNTANPDAIPIPNFASVEEGVREAKTRENKATGRKDAVAGYSKILDGPAVVNRRQLAQHGSVDNAIRRDHLNKGDSRSSLSTMGMANKGFVPNFDAIKGNLPVAANLRANPNVRQITERIKEQSKVTQQDIDWAMSNVQEGSSGFHTGGGAYVGKRGTGYGGGKYGNLGVSRGYDYWNKQGPHQQFGGASYYQGAYNKLVQQGLDPNKSFIDIAPQDWPRYRDSLQRAKNQDAMAAQQKKSTFEDLRGADLFRRHERMHAIWDQLDLGDIAVDSIKKMRDEDPERLKAYLRSMSNAFDTSLDVNKKATQLGGYFGSGHLSSGKGRSFMGNYRHKEMVDALLRSNLKDEQAIIDISWGLVNEMMADAASANWGDRGIYGSKYDIDNSREAMLAFMGGGDIKKGASLIQSLQKAKFNKGFVPNFDARGPANNRFAEEVKKRDFLPPAATAALERTNLSYTDWLSTIDVRAIAREMGQNLIVREGTGIEGQGFGGSAHGNVGPSGEQLIYGGGIQVTEPTTSGGTGSIRFSGRGGNARRSGISLMRHELQHALQDEINDRYLRAIGQDPGQGSANAGQGMTFGNQMVNKYPKEMQILWDNMSPGHKSYYGKIGENYWAPAGVLNENLAYIADGGREGRRSAALRALYKIYGDGDIAKGQRTVNALTMRGQRFETRYGEFYKGFVPNFDARGPANNRFAGEIKKRDYLPPAATAALKTNMSYTDWLSMIDIKAIAREMGQNLIIREGSGIEGALGSAHGNVGPSGEQLIYGGYGIKVTEPTASGGRGSLQFRNNFQQSASQSRRTLRHELQHALQDDINDRYLRATGQGESPYSANAGQGYTFGVQSFNKYPKEMQILWDNMHPGHKSYYGKLGEGIYAPAGVLNESLAYLAGGDRAGRKLAGNSAQARALYTIYGDGDIAKGQKIVNALSMRGQRFETRYGTFYKGFVPNFDPRGPANNKYAAQANKVKIPPAQMEAAANMSYYDWLSTIDIQKISDDMGSKIMMKDDPGTLFPGAGGRSLGSVGRLDSEGRRAQSLYLAGGMKVTQHTDGRSGGKIEGTGGFRRGMLSPILSGPQRGTMRHELMHALEDRLLDDYARMSGYTSGQLYGWQSAVRNQQALNAINQYPKEMAILHENLQQSHKDGYGPLYVNGQPNAMGGVGAMSEQLANLAAFYRGAQSTAGINKGEVQNALATIYGQGDLAKGMRIINALTAKQFNTQYGSFYKGFVPNFDAQGPKSNRFSAAARRAMPNLKEIIKNAPPPAAAGQQKMSFADWINLIPIEQMANQMGRGLEINVSGGGFSYGGRGIFGGGASGNVGRNNNQVIDTVDPTPSREPSGFVPGRVNALMRHELQHALQDEINDSYGRYLGAQYGWNAQNLKGSANAGMGAALASIAERKFPKQMAVLYQNLSPGHKQYYGPLFNDPNSRSAALAGILNENLAYLSEQNRYWSQLYSNNAVVNALATIYGDGNVKKGLSNVERMTMTGRAFQTWAGNYNKGFVPKFHDGGVVPNFNKEQPAVLLGGEGVLSHKGMKTVGGEKGLKSLNKGFVPNFQERMPEGIPDENSFRQELEKQLRSQFGNRYSPTQIENAINEVTGIRGIQNILSAELPPEEVKRMLQEIVRRVGSLEAVSTERTTPENYLQQYAREQNARRALMEMESYVFENQAQWTGRNQPPMQAAQGGSTNYESHFLSNARQHSNVYSYSAPQKQLVSSKRSADFAWPVSGDTVINGFKLGGSFTVPGQSGVHFPSKGVDYVIESLPENLPYGDTDYADMLSERLTVITNDPDLTPDQRHALMEARSIDDLLNQRIQEVQKQYDIKRFSKEFERLDDFTKLEALNTLDSVGMGIEAATMMGIAAAEKGIPKPPPLKISNTQIQNTIQKQKGALKKPGAPTTYPPGYLDPATLENGATARFDPKQKVWKAKFPDGKVYVQGAGGSWTPVGSTLKPITTRGPLPPRPQRNVPVVKLGPANKLMWPMTQRGIAELWNEHTPKSRYNMMMGQPPGNPFQGISADPSHEWLDENGNRLGKIRGAGQRPPQKNTGKKPITRKLPGSGVRPMPKVGVFGVLPIDPISLGGEMFGPREGIGTSTSTFGQFWNDVKANIKDAMESGGGIWDPTWYPGKNEKFPPPNESVYYRKGFVPNFSIFKDDHEMSGRAGYLSTKSMTINNGGELQRINNRETIVPMGKQAAIIPPHGPWKAVRENQIKGRMYEGYMPNFAGEEILNQGLERINNNRLNTQPVVQQAAQAPATTSVPDPAAWGAAAGAAMAEQAGPVIASQLEGVTMQTEGTQTIEMKGGFDIGGSALPAEAVESLQQNMLAALGGATEQIMSAMGASPEAMQKGNPRLGGISPRFN